MEQLHNSCDSVCDQLLPLSSKYPWFVVENLEAEEDGFSDHIFYPLHDPLSNYQCQIPELLGRHIQGYYHGWVILSDHAQNITLSLWNPVTSKTINFPPLILKDGDSKSIGQCCLSAPPDDPTSVLLLTRTNKPTFVFLRLLDMVVRENEVLIKLLLLGIEPSPSFNHCTHLYSSPKGSCTELFYIRVGFYEGRLEGVYLFKLDMTSVKSEEMERFKDLDMSNTTWEEVENYELFMSGKMWEEVVDLKDAMFYVNLACDHSVYYRPAITSELGGYIHIRDAMGKVLYSYHLKDNTISLSSMPSLVLPTSNVSIWECRIEDDHGKSKCTVDSKQPDDEIVVRSYRDYKTEFTESCLLNLPYDILEMILGFCVGVEYMNFRATCKRCHLAAPQVQWSIATSLRRLKTYSLISPWLMVVDKNQGIITLSGPMLGDNYFMYRLLIKKYTVQAPPTSPDCMVVGFTKGDVYIHFVAQEPSWRALGVGPYSIRFPTFMGRDLYTLRNEGELIHFKDLGEDDYSVKLDEAKATRVCCRSPAQYYLMTRDQHLLLVIVGKFGECVEVFKRSDFKREWEKLGTLGKHMIYISGTTCLCIQATKPEMENKIFFPLLHSNSRKIVFYSLETCMYHTFNGENIPQQFKDILGTTYPLFPHVWIEPSWS
ncbi:hypothetical protein Tco_1283141 [Tanacetum coccineum]